MGGRAFVTHKSGTLCVAAAVQPTPTHPLPHASLFAQLVASLPCPPSASSCARFYGRGGDALLQLQSSSCLYIHSSTGGGVRTCEHRCVLPTVGHVALLLAAVRRLRVSASGSRPVVVRELPVLTSAQRRSRRSCGCIS